MARSTSSASAHTTSSTTPPPPDFEGVIQASHLVTHAQTALRTLLDLLTAANEAPKQERIEPAGIAKLMRGIETDLEGAADELSAFALRVN